VETSLSKIRNLFTFLWYSKENLMSEEKSQLNNLKNKLIDFIHKTTPGTLIRLAIMAQIKIPKQLMDKYLS
jgi:hypothetical protein